MAAGERVGVIGDYDVDGATSTALLARYLRTLGVPVEIVIPDRLLDGYGPNVRVLDELAGRGCRLVVTLDTGTTAFGPLAHAAGLGLEVIVVDHHAAEAELPQALAVVNPNRIDQASPLKHLAAVGVTFMVLVAVSRLLRQQGAFASRARATVARLARPRGPGHGLRRGAAHRPQPRLRPPGSQGGGRWRAARPGGTGAGGGPAAVTDARQLGFALGPRINAGGRIGQSDLGARLLTTDRADEAASLAGQLHALNTERQAIERSLLEAAHRSVERQREAGLPVLMASGAGWHPGVVGIIASRLVERHHRPVIVLGLADGTAKGSARSIRGFDIGAAVIAARQAGILQQGGGHGMAAGMTLAQADLERFHRFLLDRFAAETGGGVPPPDPLELDGALSVGAAQPALATQIQQMAPYGPGNAEPRFALTEARVAQARIVGDGHVSCMLSSIAGGRVKAIAFRSATSPLGRELLEARMPLHLAGRVKLDTWQGREQASFEIEDAAPVG